MTIENKVQIGYRSVADRTLSDYRNVLGGLSIPTSHFGSVRSFLDGVKRVQFTGEVLQLSPIDVRHLQTSVNLFESMAFSFAIPRDPQQSLSFATQTLMAYSGTQDIVSLMRRAKIDVVHYNPDYSGLVAIQREDLPTRALCFKFRPQIPIQSVLRTMHDIYLALQPEQGAFYEILRHKLDIDGIKTLMSAIEEDHDLYARFLRHATNTNELHFLEQPDVLQLAEKSGVDIPALQSYLDLSVPQLDFLACYQAGDGYLAERDLIAHSPGLDEVTQGIFRLIASANAFGAPFAHDAQTMNRIGVGLVEYLRLHPEEADLKTSADFHKELSDTYFRHKMT